MALLDRLRSFGRTDDLSSSPDAVPVILRADYDEHIALPEVQERLARVTKRRRQGTGRYGPPRQTSV
jgi:hypothetical protein